VQVDQEWEGREKLGEQKRYETLDSPLIASKTNTARMNSNSSLYRPTIFETLNYYLKFFLAEIGLTHRDASCLMSLELRYDNFFRYPWNAWNFLRLQPVSRIVLPNLNLRYSVVFLIFTARVSAVSLMSLCLVVGIQVIFTTRPSSVCL